MRYTKIDLADLNKHRAMLEEGEGSIGWVARLVPDVGANSTAIAVVERRHLQRGKMREEIKQPFGVRLKAERARP